MSTLQPHGRKYKYTFTHLILVSQKSKKNYSAIARQLIRDLKRLSYILNRERHMYIGVCEEEE